MLASVIVLLLLPGVASAHGDLQGTRPEDGSTVGRAPSEVTVTLTEPPTKGAEATVSDGCKKFVPAVVSVQGNDIVLSPAGGEAGKWKVSYRAVSAVDGHQTRGKFTFTVRGKRDCTTPGDEVDPEDDVDPGDDPGIIDNPNPPDEETSWLVWVGGGTLILVAAAFIVRRSGGR